jgi:hypothetical protein
MRPLGRIYSVVPPAFDLRRSPRHPVRHLGKILTEPNALPRHCLIEEMSDGGMRIRTTSDFDAPSVFILQFADQEARYKVIWRKGHLVGAELVPQAVSAAQSCRAVP